MTLKVFNSVNIYIQLLWCFLFLFLSIIINLHWLLRKRTMGIFRKYFNLCKPTDVQQGCGAWSSWRYRAADVIVVEGESLDYETRALRYCQHLRSGRWSQSLFYKRSGFYFHCSSIIHFIVNYALLIPTSLAITCYL